MLVVLAGKSASSSEPHRDGATYRVAEQRSEKSVDVFVRAQVTVFVC
jgi:hypothetical protein